MTTLLDRVILDATDSSVPLSETLRRALVVAKRLQNRSFETWILQELQGYSEEAPLPTYRGPHRSQLQGNFIGPMAHTMNGMSIPSHMLPEGLRDAAETISLRQPIAELETLAESDQAQLAWSGDAIAHINYLKDQGEVGGYEMYDLYGLYQRLSPNVVRGALDNVRTEVLQIALGLEGVDPGIGSQTVDTATREQANTVINNHFHGGQHNVAQLSSQITQSVTVIQGDLSSLKDRLGEIGVEPDDITELAQIIVENQSAQPSEAVHLWYKKLLAGAGRVGTDLAVGVSSSAVWSAILAYYGMA